MFRHSCLMSLRVLVAWGLVLLNAPPAAFAQEFGVVEDVYVGRHTISPFGGIGRYQNLLIRSEEIDNASWVKTNVAAITANGITGPDGTASAEALAPATAAATNAKQTSTTAAAALTAYTFSIWAKVPTATKNVILTVGDDGATVTTNTATAALTADWERFKVSYTAAATPDGSVFVQVGDVTWTADTIHLWGAQLEQIPSGAETDAGVYVKTTTSTVASIGRGLVSNTDLLVQGTQLTSSGLLDATKLTGVVPVVNGGTGQTSYTDGQLLIGNTTGNTLAKATLTGTANEITVTNGAGAITLALPNHADTDISADLEEEGQVNATAVTGNATLAAAGQVLRSTGDNTAAWGKLDLADTDAVTGILADGNVADVLTLTNVKQTSGTTNGHTVPAVADDTFTLNAATQTLTNKTLTAPKVADLGFLADANGNELLILDTVASAVNELTLANAATTGAPTITASGGDANISINFVPKGSGSVTVGGSAVLTAEADTLATVTGRGASTSTAVTLNGGATIGANQDVTWSAGTGSLVMTNAVTNASEQVIDLAPGFTGGATDGLTYAVIDIAAFSPTNAAGTDTVTGINLGNLTDPGATITSNAITIGSGWDTVINNNGTAISSAELNLLDGQTDLEEETHGAEHDGTDGDYVTDSGDTMTGALAVEGSTDVIQLRVKGNATQSTNPNLFVVEKSDGTDMFTVNNSGNVDIATDLVLSGKIDGPGDVAITFDSLNFNPVKFTGTSVDFFGTTKAMQVLFTGPSTTNFYNLFLNPATASGSSITNLYNLTVNNPTHNGTTLTNNYGLMVADQTAGTNDYGIAIAGADTQALWISSAADTFDAANGIAFGLSLDTNLYRSALNTLKTDDSLIVAGASLQIPQGGSPTVNAAGQIAVDTTDNQLVYYGGAETVLTAKRQLDITLESPVDADNFLLGKLQDGITVSAIHCIVDPANTGESVVIKVEKRDTSGDTPVGLDGANTLTCGNAGASDTVLSSPGVLADSWWSLDIGTVTGTVTQLSVTIFYTVNRE